VRSVAASKEVVRGAAEELTASIGAVPGVMVVGITGPLGVVEAKRRLAPRHILVLEEGKVAFARGRVVKADVLAQMSGLVLMGRFEENCHR